MDPPQLAFWNQVRVQPVKWAMSPWGDLGGGFWVVAVIGQKCIWFNDIEDGFNTSGFKSFGVIAEYWCNQSSLLECIVGNFESFMAAIAGMPANAANNCGPPENIWDKKENLP
jgi:hypothetical protein